MYKINNDNKTIKEVKLEELNVEDEYALYRVATDDYACFVYIYPHETTAVEITQTELLEPLDFKTPRDLKLARLLFMDLYESCNGCNTWIDFDTYDDCGYSKEDIEEFMDSYPQLAEGLDMDEEGVGIFLAYLTKFNIDLFDPFEHYHKEEN